MSHGEEKAPEDTQVHPKPNGPDGGKNGTWHNDVPNRANDPQRKVYTQ